MKVESGEKLVCKELCEGAKLRIQSIKMVVDLYSLPIVGLDVVLGVQWLEKLGKIVSNYKRMSMAFMQGDKWMTLKANTKAEGKVMGLEGDGQDYEAWRSVLFYFNNITAKGPGG